MSVLVRPVSLPRTLGAGQIIDRARIGHRLARAPGTRADLDGLRGLAITLVLLEHTGIDKGGQQWLPFTPAMAGVTVFFVLSGYLITGLLIRPATVDLRAFYVRRFWRLAPALAVVIAVVLGLVAVGYDDRDWVPGLIGAATFTSNWLQIAGADLGLLGHAWSLSIEEQFYLLWPLTFVMLPRRILLPLAIGGSVVGCAMYGLWIGPVYHSTLTNAGALLAGCAIALWGGRLSWPIASLGVALIAASAVFWWQPAAVVGASLVVAGRSSALNPLGMLGRRAYSLYLWSWPCVLLLGGWLALVATLIAAEASYRFVETPFRTRSRAAPRDHVHASQGSVTMSAQPERAPAG